MILLALITGAMGGNSMGSGGGGGGGGGQSFGNAKQDLVYKMVCSCTRDEGLQRDEVRQYEMMH